MAWKRPATAGLGDLFRSLVPQVALGDQHEPGGGASASSASRAPSRRSTGWSSILAARARCELAHLRGADLPLRQVDGGLDRREHVALDPGSRRAPRLPSSEVETHRAMSSTVRASWWLATACSSARAFFLEDALVVPERVVRVEADEVVRLPSQVAALRPGSPGGSGRRNTATMITRPMMISWK